VGNASVKVDLRLFIIFNHCNIEMNECLLILAKQMVALASVHVSVPHGFNLKLFILFIFTLQDGSAKVVECSLYNFFGEITSTTPEQEFRVV
jgi:hypothetical protein